MRAEAPRGNGGTRPEAQEVVVGGGPAGGIGSAVFRVLGPRTCPWAVRNVPGIPCESPHPGPGGGLSRYLWLGDRMALGSGPSLPRGSKPESTEGFPGGWSGVRLVGG